MVSAIRQAVTDEHGLEVHAISLIQPGSILKTSSGKIRRQSCKEAYLSQTLELLGQWVQPQAEPLANPADASGFQMK